MLHLHGFFEQARLGRLTAIRCRRCAELAIPPREACSGCGRSEWEPVPLAGTGTIESFRVIGSAEAGPPTSYAVADVRLTEGVSLAGRIVDIPLDALAIGQAVRFRALVDGLHTAIAFGPL